MSKDFWEGYVPEPVKPAPAPGYCKHCKQYTIEEPLPAQPVPDAFEQLMREADKPTQVPEGIAKYAAALVAGTHEITSVTIRPKRTWVGLTDEELSEVYNQTDWDIVGGWEYERAIEAKLKEKNT